MSQNTPYDPPQFPNPSAPRSFTPAAPPAVLTWYKVYCGLMALLYILCVVFGVVLLALPAAALEAAEEEAIVLRVQGGILLVMGVVLAGVFGLGLFLPRRTWAWIYGIVTIGIGMTSACCLPITVPLIIFWLKAETKSYFQIR